MRWERLFGDLEGQLEAAQRAEDRADRAELTRAERSTVHLSDRMRASLGQRLRVLVGDSQTYPEAAVDGEVLECTGEWVVLGDDAGHSTLVRIGAVQAVRGLSRYVAPAAGEVERRLGLGHALRALARDRVAVRVLTASGSIGGRIDAVGADYLELGTESGLSWVVRFDAVACIRVGFSAS